MNAHPLLALLCVSAVLHFGGEGRADEVKTADGRTLEGRVLKSGDTLELLMLDGITVLIPSGRVKEVSRKPTAYDELEVKRSGVSAPAQLVELAEWCQTKGLLGERRSLLEAALRADPEYLPARRQLKQVKFENRWYREEELEELTLKPHSAQTRAAQEKLLPACLASVSGSGIFVSSAPVGLCVHLAAERELPHDKFDVKKPGFLRGRTPLWVPLEPGDYYVSVELVSSSERDYQPEGGMGYYKGQGPDAFLYANVYRVTVESGTPAYMISLFARKGVASAESLEPDVPREAAFAVDASEFAAVYKRLRLPDAQQSAYGRLLARSGKIIHVENGEIRAITYAGKGRLASRAFRVQ